ncbi:MAG: hypothetical protein DI570_11520 [Phenylobacterium zucineum]|nr:MAG: hypothetical protein DI570_11520 [Phenylobacterium zucineum]
MLLPHRLPRPVRLGLYALATAILMVLCMLPTEDLPDPGTGDRFEHTAAWFVLTATGYALAPERKLAIPLFALAYGVVVEIAQAAAPLGRHGDVADFLADTVGVALAVAGYAAVRLVRRPGSTTP